MEELNQLVFSWINATPTSSPLMLAYAKFLAQDLILIVPLLMVGLWLWAPKAQQALYRILIAKTLIALLFALLLATAIGMLLPHDRPFAMGIGYTFIPHVADASFPSDHGTVMFTFALGFFCWLGKRSGALLMLIALAVAWSRVYLGVHWPLDMLGAFLVAIAACLFAQLLWNLVGENLLTPVINLYRRLFSPLIRRGWINA